MTKILILGANGQLARNTTKMLFDRTDAALTLYLRRAHRLANPDPQRVTIVEGDVLDAETLKATMQGQDVVYANLTGDMARQARVIVGAMQATGVKRLIFISSMGIYGEVPGERYRSVLDPYRDSAALDREFRPELHRSATRLVHPRSCGQLSDHEEGGALQGT